MYINLLLFWDYKKNLLMILTFFIKRSIYNVYHWKPCNLDIIILCFDILKDLLFKNNVNLLKFVFVMSFNGLLYIGLSLF